MISQATASSAKLRRKWLIPTVIAVIFFAGDLANELFGNLVGTIPTPYRWVVWAAIAISLVTAIAVAVFEKRLNIEASPNAHRSEGGSISVGGNAPESTNVLGIQNIVASERGVAAERIAAPVATGEHGRAVQTSTYIEKQIIETLPRLSALHRLPSPPRDFTGRIAELDDLMNALEKGGATISGLHGMGGIGKTALALKLAEQLTPRYPDAQFFMDLKGTSGQPLSPSEAMAHVIRAYRPETKLPESEAEAQGLYLSLLHEQRALLLIDNAYDSQQVLPLLPPATCLLLVTSRRHFTLPGLYAKNLDVLPANEARDLLLAIAPRLDDLADTLAELCGYLPLALRLAGSAVAERMDLHPDDYVQRLTQAQQRLQFIDASLCLSYELLAPEFQMRWRQLAVFPGSFDKAAAAAVWQLNSEQAQDILSTLLTYSLVEYAPATGRYFMHDLVRLFSEACLNTEERAACQQRHAAHYATVLRSAKDLYKKGGESLLRGLALFDLEWGNTQAGHAWAAGNSEKNKVAEELSSEYPDAGTHILCLRQHPRERILWREAALAAARRLQDRLMEGAHLGNLAIAYADLGETRKAIEFYEQALIIARETCDRRCEGTDLGNLGIAYAAMGETRKAIEFYKRHIAIAREIGDRQGEGNALGNLGNAYAALGETGKAIEFYEQYLVIACEIGDRRGEANALCNLGRTYADSGKIRKAIEFFEQSLSIARDLGDRRSEGNALGLLGLVYVARGKIRKAIEFFEQSLSIAREIEDRRGESNALDSLGLAYAALGETGKAIQFYEQSLALTRERGYRRGEGYTLWNMSLALHRLGERKKAMVYAEMALKICEQIEDRHTAVLRQQLAEWRGQKLNE